MSATSIHRKPKNLKLFIATVYSELLRTRVFVAAAALAFFSLLSLVPLLMILSALLAYLPIPHLFHQMLLLTGDMLPAEELSIVEDVVGRIIPVHRGGVLFLGLLGYLWSATGAFGAAIEALDVAYDVERGRSWWRDRLRAMLLILTTGTLSLISVLVLLAGQHLGRLLAELLPVPLSFTLVWPTLRLTITFVTFILAVELLYYLAPNRKQGFLSTFPGALVAVVGWFIGSVGLNLYISHFANYKHTYGSLGTMIVLMLWFYLVAFSVLTGAETNAELIKTLAERRKSGEDPFDRPIPGIPSA
jgi:membrane protein